MNTIDDTINTIAKNKGDMLRETRYAERHLESLQASKSVEQAIVGLAEYLTRYFSSYVGKTEVVNPTTVVSTPDIVHVVKSVRDLSETVQQSQLDISPIVEQLAKLEAQLTAIPKELVQLPEQKEEVKVSNLGDIDFSELEKAIKEIHFEQPSLAPVLKGLQAVVQAVGAIHLPATDLTPLDKPLKDIEKAVKAIPLPEKTDTTGIEKQLDKSNKLLKDIYNKPVGGNGGGGSSWPAVDIAGNAQPLTVSGGAVQTSPFLPNANITTTISGGVITQTDGTKTLTITITGGTITEVWS